MAHLNIGSLIFDDLDQVDLTGPHEVLSRLPDSTWKIYAKTMAPARDMKGLRILPDALLEEAPQLDVLHVPGGFGVDAAMADPVILEWVRRQALGAQALHWRIQVAGMPASTSSQATREALREALREPPETLPPWAQPAATAPARRRWRLAFWRRDEPTTGTKTPARTAKTAAASRTAQAKPTVKPLARPAARAATKPLASSKKLPTNKALAGPRKATAAIDPVARRNRVVLVSGVLLSAALAGGLGTWLSIQPSITRDAQPAGPMSKPTAATTTAAIALRARP